MYWVRNTKRSATQATTMKVFTWFRFTICKRSIARNNPPANKKGKCSGLLEATEGNYSGSLGLKYFSGQFDRFSLLITLHPHKLSKLVYLTTVPYSTQLNFNYFDYKFGLQKQKTFYFFYSHANTLAAFVHSSHLLEAIIWWRIAGTLLAIIPILHRSYHYNIIECMQNVCPSIQIYKEFNRKRRIEKTRQLHQPQIYNLEMAKPLSKLKIKLCKTYAYTNLSQHRWKSHLPQSYSQ